MKLRWSALFFAAFVACDRPATQIVVRVDSDMREGDELRAVRVSMRRLCNASFAVEMPKPGETAEFALELASTVVVPADDSV